MATDPGLFSEDEIDYADASDYFDAAELERQRQEQAARDAEMADRVQRQVDGEAQWFGTPGVDRAWSGNPTAPPDGNWNNQPSTVNRYPDYSPGADPTSSVQPGYAQPQQAPQAQTSYRFGATGAFDPSANPYWQWAEGVSETGARSADTLMNAGFRGLTMPVQSPYAQAPAPLNAPAPTNVVGTSDVRDTQQEAIDLMLARARGEEPGIGEALMNEGAVRTAAAFDRAGIESAAAYEGAAQDAASTYADAIAAQEEQARANNEDAARRAASIVAMQRGGNVALAGLQAGNEMAVQTAGMNRDLLNQTAAARRQAADMQSRSQTDIQRAHQEAGNRAAEALAAGDYQAAQLAAQEQQQYAALLLEGTGQTRGMDLNEVDQLLQQSGMNAEQAYQYDLLNANDAFRYAQMNGDWEQATNILRADISQSLLAQGVQLNNASLDRVMQLALADINAGMAYETALLEAKLRTEQRMDNFNLGRYGVESANFQAEQARNDNIISSVLNAGGTMGAASLPFIFAPAVASDERRKDIKEQAPTPDFRAAKAFRYTYDDEAGDRYGYDPEEEFFGPMAQDLPDETVRESRYGDLEVDIGRLALSLASAVGELQERVDAQEDFGTELFMQLMEAEEYGPQSEPEPDDGDEEMAALVQIMIGEMG